MNTHELINRLMFKFDHWSDETKKEMASDNENFVWFSHHTSIINNEVFNSSYGSVIYQERYHDYIVNKEDHLLPTDKIINKNITKLEGMREVKSYGLINITPNKDNNNEIVYYIDMGKDPLTASFVICHNGNVYHYYPKIRYKQGNETIELYLYPGKFMDNEDNFMPYVYKKGYADIAVSKEGYNTGMTLQGYILGYRIYNYKDNVDFDIRCFIPNSDNNIFPTFEIAVFPHSEDITDVEIYLTTDHPFIKYKNIQLPRLVKGSQQGFDMIAEKYDRFGGNKVKYVINNAYLARLDRYHRNIIIFTKNGIDYSIHPTITINNKQRYIIPEIVNNVSNILYENLNFSSENKFLGASYSVASSQKILDANWNIKDSIIVYLKIEVVNDELKFKIQIQNPWFMDNEVHIIISPKTWVEEKDRHISEFLNSDDIHLTLEPGKKATIESKNSLSGMV